MSKTVAVTGATEGIGRQTALELAQLGWRVLVHGRTEAKALAATKSLAGDVKGAELVPVWGDLSSLAQTRALATQLLTAAPSLDVLLNNAGVFMTSREVSGDGFELTFQVNHLAPVLLTHLVLPALQKAGKARVVNVSSMAHARGHVDLKDLNSSREYEGYTAYATSKLMNVYFTHELARRLPAGVTTSALHPGVISTRLLRTGFGAGGADLSTGAKTSVYCATSTSLEGVTGRYYSDGREARTAAQATDPKLEQALYLESCKLVGVEPLTPRA